MKVLARGLACVLLVLASGCSSLMQKADSGYEPPGAEVPLVRLPLDEEANRIVDRAREALAGEDTARARDHLETLDGDYRYEPEVLLTRGMLARMSDRPEAAIRHYETLLQVEPYHPAAANDLALLYREQGRIDDARGLLETTLERHPERARLHYNLAVLYELYLVDLEQALEHYRQYQDTTDDEDERVARWILDLERRVE